jgi:hypothetical protein
MPIRAPECAERRLALEQPRMPHLAHDHRRLGAVACDISNGDVKPVCVDPKAVVPITADT